ncbi:hypothetical protein GPECTOR_15g345 [Gonium pectorale]|uniref:Uncharacterized protein n=1 Tax=Gonium pectorale TaxID=33097 RepID=A0A150GLJ1_GONPE|nr:hypothetical protein GPECTOR_15g345 [Gonium pectorale]|eukprot:KXZ50661.1 hypothetical protein GPECTOR_15g345 [Gonium pectorale]
MLAGQESAGGATPAPAPPPTAYTAVDFIPVAEILQASGPLVRLLPGQQLTLRSLSLHLADVARPLGPAPTLPSLAPSALVTLPADSTLILEDVTLVLSQSDLRAVITTGTTVAGSSGGSGGGSQGGNVIWRNVTLTSVGYGLPAPYPCSARPVTSGEQLGALVVGLFDDTEGPVILSLTSNMTIPGPEEWQTPTIPFGCLLALLGDPSRTTILDLAGREALWRGRQGTGSVIPGEYKDMQIEAHLYDLTLVNLPVASSPATNGELLSLSVLSFKIDRKFRLLTDSVESSVALLTLSRCTLVVPDLEVAFLYKVQRAADALHIADVTEKLAMRLRAVQVLLSDCTLLSASAYATAPTGGPPLLPRSWVWPPLELHGDQAEALKWGSQARLDLRTPLILQDLVLYNLAPGGVHPPDTPEYNPLWTRVAPPPALTGPDAHWANSSLPLWYLIYDRRGHAAIAAAAIATVAAVTATVAAVTATVTADTATVAAAIATVAAVTATVAAVTATVAAVTATVAAAIATVAAVTATVAAVNSTVAAVTATVADDTATVIGCALQFQAAASRTPLGRRSQ